MAEIHIMVHSANNVCVVTVSPSIYHDIMAKKVKTLKIKSALVAHQKAHRFHVIYYYNLNSITYTVCPYQERIATISIILRISFIEL